MVSGIDVVLFRPDNELKRLAERALELGDRRRRASAARAEDALARTLSASAERPRVAGRLGGRQDSRGFTTPTATASTTTTARGATTRPFRSAHLRNYIQRLQAGEDIARPLAEVSAERDRITGEYRALLDDEEPAPHSTRTSGSPARCSRTSRATTSTSSTGTTRSSGTRSASSARCWRAPRLPRRRRRTSSTCSATRSPTRSSTCGLRGRPARRAAARATGRRSWRAASRSWRRCGVHAAARARRGARRRSPSR